MKNGVAKEFAPVHAAKLFGPMACLKEGGET
jgi:hypothetical protein